MMRQAFGCTKMKRLCRNLDIPTYAGVGLLESLWHLAARETPQGNIGKLSNEDIALAFDWRGDEDKLITALVDSGWLDEHETHRLVIHDWHEHADDGVDNQIARRGLLYANGARPRMKRLSVREKTDLCARFPVLCAQRANSCAVPVTSNQLPVTSNLKPEEENTLSAGASSECTLPSSVTTDESKSLPSKNTDTGTQTEVLLVVANAIHARHPACRRDISANQTAKTLTAILRHNKIAKAKQDEYLAALDAEHERHCNSDDWQKEDGQYAKALGNYLAPTKGRYEPQTEEAKPKRPVAVQPLFKSLAEQDAYDYAMVQRSKLVNQGAKLA